jgi:hypothetical protein
MKIHGASNLEALTTEDTEITVKEKLFISNRVELTIIVPNTITKQQQSPAFSVVKVLCWTLLDL